MAYSYVNLGDGVTGVASTFDGSSGGDVFKFRGRAMVGDRVAAEAEFAAMVVET